MGVQVKPLATRDAQSSVSVLARVQSDGSHYYLATRANDTVEIGKVVRGRGTMLASASYPAALQFWRSLTLVVKGGTLVGVVNGSPTLTATDTQLRRGRVGLATTNAVASFDDVTVQSYAAGTPDTQAPLAVAARDAAGNVSPISSRTSIAQPPSFPKSGTDAAPGSPVLTGTAADGRGILSWTPATDNVGVVEYHVYLIVNIDEVRVLAKVSQPSATVSVNGGKPAGPGGRVRRGLEFQHEPPGSVRAGAHPDAAADRAGGLIRGTVDMPPRGGRVFLGGP